MSMFATKPIEPFTPGASKDAPLRRVLGPVDLTLLGIGAIIGTGIFVLTGQAAAAHAGPAVVLADGSTVTALVNLPAMLIAAAATVLLVIGIQESARVNAVIVVIKVGVVLLIIGLGGMCISAENWRPFIPVNTGEFGEYGWSGILRGAGVIFFAYIGFDAVSTAAQEAKNPQRDMPRGIIGSLVICTVLYVLVSGVMVGLVPYQQLGVPAPMALAVDAARIQAQGSAWQGVLDLMPLVVKLGAILGLSSTIIVQMMAQPRVFLAMGRDGLLPAWASTIHPRFRTPHITTILTGVIVMLASGFTSIGTLGELVSIGTLFAFVIVSIGVVVLRKTRPDLECPFRTPFVPALPVASALVSFALMLALPGSTWVRLIVWMVLGLAIYFLYGRRHSRLASPSRR
jgi:APA family basic amino acid/polyamine antiporter